MPFAFGGEAEPDRLRARDRRRRPAGADRHARPAAARPRDDARAGAAGQRGAVPLRAGRQPVPGLPGARLAVLIALPALAASGAPSIALALGLGRRGDLRSLELRRRCGASRPGSSRARSLAAVVGARARRLGAGALGAATPARRCWASLRLLALVHLAGLAAGAVDAVALAQPAAAPAHRRCRWGARGRAAGRLHRDGRLRPRADAGACPPLAVLAAFALPTLQRSTAAAIDWFSVFFFTVCAIVDLGHLRRDADRRAAPSRRPTSRGWRPASSPSFSLARARCCAVAGTLAWLWLVQLAHRPQPPPALEEPGAAGRRRGTVLAAADDAVLPLLDYARSYRPLVAAHRAARAAATPAWRRRTCRARSWPRSSTWAASGSMPARRSGRRRLRLPAAAGDARRTGAGTGPAGDCWRASARPTDRRRDHRDLPARAGADPDQRSGRDRRHGVRRQAPTAGRRAHPRGRKDEPERRALARLRSGCRARRRGAAPRA